ncbi:hypothetical protein [Variovorax boronicumulans]|uniref:hypothetical protein n=1 Tax=Variovorax boronicumulans TaxID=436515 RepID=UPI0027867C90|nr:hypothetical protein [Variovorax boronicumulans]MDQ0045398.1 hypothetical protein [Variovorax boronicumulans]
MSEEPMPSDGSAGSTRRKLADVLGKRVELQTAEGTLYARHLSIGDLAALHTLLGDWAVSDKALGREVVRRLVSRSKDAFDEPLAESEVGTIAPLEELAGAVARATGTVLRHDGGDVVAQLGAEVRQQAHDSIESSRRIAESFGSIGSGLQSQLSKSLDGMLAATRGLSSIAMPGAELARPDQTTFELGPRSLPDIGQSPLIRSSELTVEKLDAMATQMAALARCEAELLRTITLDVIPKWEKAGKASDAASKRALMLARWSLGIALVALIASALVPYHILKLQDDAAAEDRKIDTAARARQEGLMRDQVEAIRALRSQSEQQAARIPAALPAARTDSKNGDGKTRAGEQ